jgi:polysaccharide biosynthesis/export protein
MKRIQSQSYLLIAILTLCSISFSSCVTNYTTTYLQTRKNLPQYKQTEYVAYHLRPEDKIAIRVISIKEDVNQIYNNQGGLSQQNAYKIYSDSTIDIPFVSHIKIGGLTIDEATKVLETKVKELDANATVVIALANEVFYVIGEAGKGQFPLYKDKLTIFQALALAGDVKFNGDRGRIQIIRESAKGPVIKQFDIRTRSIIESEYYYVYPNDIIYVGTKPSSFFRIESYNALLGMITTSVAFLVLVLNNLK